MLAVAGTAVLAAAVAGVLKLLSVSEHNLIIGAASVVIASLIWLPVTRRWRARAHLCWASSIFLFVTYLVFALDWTFASHLGVASTIGALLLWVFELFAADHGLRLPVGDLRRARHRALDEAGNPAGQVRRSARRAGRWSACTFLPTTSRLTW